MKGKNIMEVKKSDREVLLEEERRYFRMIRFGITGLLELIKDDDVIDDVIEHHAAKQRIDESNFNKVLDRARVILEGDDLIKLEKYAKVIRGGVKEISKRYIGWAQARALAMSTTYHIDRIEAVSVAGWALYRACFRYIPKTNFSSYAEHWIRQGLERIQSPYICTLDAHIPGHEGNSRETYLDQKTDDLPSTQIMLENKELTTHVVTLMDSLPTKEKAIINNWWVNGEVEDHNGDLVKTFARVALETFGEAA
jgi:hypothetical protein